MMDHRHRPDAPLRGLPEAKGWGGIQNHGKAGQAIRAEMGGGHGLPLGVNRNRDRTCASAEHDLAYRLCRPACHGKVLAGEGQNKAKAQGQDRVQRFHRPEI